MPSFIDPLVQEEFLREGFVTTRLLDTAQADALRAEISAINAGNWAVNHRDASNYLSMYDKDEARKAKVDAAVQRAIYPAFADHLRDFKPVVNTLFAKPAFAPGTPLHQHAPVSQRPFEAHITVWCALSDCGPETSALFVVPRSHQLYRFLRVYQRPNYFDAYRDVLVERHARPLTFKAGEALIMENSLLHGSFGNQGSEARMAVGTLLMPEGSDFMLYRPDGDTVVAMDPAGEAIAKVQMMMVGPTPWTGPVRTRFPAWSTWASLEQTEALLALNGPRASETYDPLELVAHLAPRPARKSFDWRASARRLPGAVPAVRLARRAASKLRGSRA